MPIGRGRILGLVLIAGAAAAFLRGQTTEGQSGGGAGLSRFRERPAVAAALLALGGTGVLLRSFMLTAYALGLSFAFAKDAVELEEPQVPRGDGDDAWEYDETQV